MNDERYMRECLHLAQRGAGRVSPNPMVGAVLVRRGRIVARGYHRRFGGLHAEAECIGKYAGDLRGTTLYVNLEPCSHHGKTPPCVDMIVASGIREVVVGIKDPNPLVAGRGIRTLRRAGVSVRVGVLENECRELNRFFLRHIATGRPYVHLKIAQSLDGVIAPVTRKKRWISSVESRKLVHRWRAEHDAVLVGAGTIIADDPELTVRLSPGRSPTVVILDGRLSIPEGARVFKTGARVYVAATSSAMRRHSSKVRRIAARGGAVLSFSASHGVIPLRSVLRRLYRLNIGSVLVEGGAQVFAQFVREGCTDELSLFIAPIFLGRGIRAFSDCTARTHPSTERNMVVGRTGSDVLVKVYFA